MDFSEVEVKDNVSAGNGVESDKEATHAAESGESSNTEEQSQSCEDLKEGDKFYGTIRTHVDGENKSITDIFTVENKKEYNSTMVVRDSKGNKYTTNSKTAQKKDYKKELERRQQEAENKRKQQEELERRLKEDHDRRMEEKRKKEEFEAKATTYEQLNPMIKLETLIDMGMNNIWMVGEAGSGKTTMAKMVADKLNLPYYIVSCGIGTSAAEFVGYKYPSRESTKFAEYYQKPSIIVVDEITALDPAVAQVLNAALANNQLETTTGLIHRDPGCIIIATSNTFGNGASRQYVANNQLDASTIDRFVGATIEVTYSEEYEAQFDSEVVEYVKDLRKCIKKFEIRRVASTRMIIAAEKAKKHFLRDWRDLMIKPWTASEKMLVQQYFEEKKLVTNNDTSSVAFNATFSNN